MEKEKNHISEQMDALRKEKAAVDEQLTETFFSLEQMKAEWNAKDRDYHQQLERCIHCYSDFNRVDLPHSIVFLAMKQIAGIEGKQEVFKRIGERESSSSGYSG